MQRKGDLPKGAVSRLIAALETQFGKLPTTTKRAADLAAARLGVFTGAIRAALTEALDLDRALGGIARHDYRLVGGPAPGARVSPARGRRGATGMMIPGHFDGRDDIPVRVSRGEVILNPAQQRIIGIDRIVGALRATGGIIGGDGAAFARGGIVAAASRRARAQLGEPYGKPSRGQSRTGPDSWDCSGYATYVAGVNVGGTTATAYRSSRRVRDHSRYPIVWGFRKSHPGGYRGGYDEHMGVRVGGVWYQTSGGRVAQTGSDGDWQEIRVPHGLEYLTDADGGPVGESATGRPSLAQSRRMHRGAVTAARRLLRRGAVAGRSVTEVLGETLTTAGRGSSLREKRRRASAEAAVRAAGVKNPEKIRVLGEIEVLRLRRQEVDRDARLVRNAAKKVRAQIARWREHARKLYAALAKTDPRNGRRIRQLLDAIRNAKDREREAVQELRALIAQAADLEAEAAELDWDIGQLVDEVAQLDDTDTAEGESGPSADQQAQLDQATRRAEVAERQASAAESFIRAIGSSSDIDPASGAVTIVINAPGGLVHEQEVGRWVVEALRGQGAPGVSVSRSAA
jgi:hypothetical protein